MAAAAEDLEEVEEEGLYVRQQVQKGPARGINVARRDVNISKEGKVIVGGKEELGRTAAELEEGVQDEC